MVARIGGVFDRAQEVSERLKSGPEPQETDATSLTPPRWTLERIASAFPFFKNRSVPGIWLALHAWGIGWREGQVQYYSPDPAYRQKVAHLLSVLRTVGASGGRQVALFVDEMGFLRWPEPAHNWTQVAPAPTPVADRKRSKAGQWRLIGALDAMSGRVLSQDNYIVGRRQVGAFLQHIDHSYPDTEKLFIIWDNWSIHSHAEVLAQAALLPRIEIVGLPTYAPWLNPIEKLWRKLRQDLLYLHRHADAWDAFRVRVRAFLGQFDAGSDDLRRYVGLSGTGLLTTALRGQ